jgi:hypothetical protein
LLKIAVAGPIAGYTVGLVLLLLGFFIPPSDGIGVVVDPSVFHESFLAGGIGKLYASDRSEEILINLCLHSIVGFILKNHINLYQQNYFIPISFELANQSLFYYFTLAKPIVCLLFYKINMW